MENQWWEYQTLEEAIDWALWLNFRYHLKNEVFSVVDGPEYYSVVNQSMLSDLDTDKTYKLPKNNAVLTWNRLTQMKKQESLPSNWETLWSAFRGIGSEVLHFAVHYQISFRLLLCHELASRGLDHTGKWIGFEKAEEYWKTVYEKTKD